MDINSVAKMVYEVCGKAGIGVKIPVRENGRLSRVLGRVKYEDEVTPVAMEFSRHYLANATDADIRETVIHECAHLVATLRSGERHGHDSYFEKIYHELGGSHQKEGSGHAVEWNGDPTKMYKYVSHCSACGEYLCGAVTARTNWVKYHERCTSACCNAPIILTQNW